ncbi:hypothetical protein [Hyphomicrobium sp.]|uniref:hypothetical protein n=1 Tax=Hyphomicrobium sp. TaxID=82 RepID=UPI002FDFE3C5
MSNIDLQVTMPDSIDRLIDGWYWEFGESSRYTREQTKEAFQEIINLIGCLMPFEPDMNDIMYYRQMDENVAVFGWERKRTPEADAIGKAFLRILKERVNAPFFEGLLAAENGRDDGPSDE